MNQQPKTVQTIILIAILALVLVVISSSLLTQNSGRLAYSDVLDLFETERVESFVLQGDTLTQAVDRVAKIVAADGHGKLAGEHQCALRGRAFHLRRPGH